MNEFEDSKWRKGRSNTSWLYINLTSLLPVGKINTEMLDCVSHESTASVSVILKTVLLLVNTLMVKTN